MEVLKTAACVLLKYCIKVIFKPGEEWH